MNTEERKQHRQERLAALLREKYGGQQVALANAADIPASLVSRYIKGGKGIGEDMVSKIETNTGYFGWFSPDHAHPIQTYAHAATPDEQILLALYRGLTKRQKGDTINNLTAQKQANDTILDELTRGLA